jgi:hypothetical protein
LRQKVFDVGELKKTFSLETLFLTLQFYDFRNEKENFYCQFLPALKRGNGKRCFIFHYQKQLEFAEF